MCMCRKQGCSSGGWFSVRYGKPYIARGPLQPNAGRPLLCMTTSSPEQVYQSLFSGKWVGGVLGWTGHLCQVLSSRAGYQSSACFPCCFGFLFWGGGTASVIATPILKGGPTVANSSNQGLFSAESLHLKSVEIGLAEESFSSAIQSHDECPLLGVQFRACPLRPRLFRGVDQHFVDNQLVEV